LRQAIEGLHLQDGCARLDRRGGSGKKVTSKKQAVAIGLNKARKAGKKVAKKK
jgi:hypothetical protein